ncbi:GGDEF domain-containing protein [Qipengyuania sp. 6B39]|uniref:GGDEF domain-containing protein n=1 Tax=Qipengyuania proteolytica TaxID=2867239 RepID=UPI001C8918E2|nr:GGDEF domain-containing protein [Qipengyuania proteolytica]
MEATDLPHDARATREKLDYAIEVRREAVLSMLSRERYALAASLLGLAVMAVSVAALPVRGLLGWFLALRLLAFVMTRWAASRLEKRIRARAEIGSAQLTLFLAMCATGASVALMLWPAPPGSPTAATATIQVVILVVVTLIAVTMAAFPGPRDGMLVSFWLVSSAVVALHPGRIDQVFLLVSLLFTIGVRVYASNTGQQIIRAAQTTVENKQLTEELAESLARSEFLSTRDPLTGLYNRRRLFDEGHARHLSSQVHLLMIDLDHFKSINDGFGHAAGDQVLVAAAQAVRRVLEPLAIRREQPVFRLGGEEFLVLLEGLDLAEAERVAEDVRLAIAAVGPSLGRYAGIPVTASIGLACWRPGENLGDALQRADLACYEAKDRGRNRVRCAA